MDGFTYHNIFETKGVEYLVIIAFFAILIPFWLILNRQAKLTKKIHDALNIITASALRMPLGLFYSRQHTWTFLEKSGIAKVDIDDLLLHLTGEVKLLNLKNAGDLIDKGEPFAEIEHQGKRLKLHSPVAGEIVVINAALHKNASRMNDDPYGKGWILKVKPTNWIADTSSHYLAEEATRWSENELARVKDFLAATMVKFSPEPTATILQDGGELRNHTLSELPKEVWEDFGEHFLKP